MVVTLGEMSGRRSAAVDIEVLSRVFGIGGSAFEAGGELSEVGVVLS